jgi:hypothetical protein
MKIKSRSAIGTGAVLAVVLSLGLFLTAGLTPAQEMTGKVISVAGKGYDPLKGGEGPSLSTLGPVSLDQRGIVRGTNALSWWVNIAANALSYSDYKAGLAGSFEALTFSVYRETNRYIYEARGGSGALKNEKGDVIAEGKLGTTEDWLSMSGKEGTTFKFGEYGGPVESAWGNLKPGEFATLELTNTDEWRIEDARFSFLLEVRQLGRATLFVRLPESIVRASIIKLPKGDVVLFGYRIAASEDGATVKFQHGAVIECQGCKAGKP